MKSVLVARQVKTTGGPDESSIDRDVIWHVRRCNPNQMTSEFVVQSYIIPIIHNLRDQRVHLARPDTLSEPVKSSGI